MSEIILNFFRNKKWKKRLKLLQKKINKRIITLIKIMREGKREREEELIV